MNEPIEPDHSTFASRPSKAQGGNGSVVVPKGSLASAKSLKPRLSAAEPDASISLDLAALDLAGYLTPTKMRSRLGEQYRIIKRPLLKHALAPGDEDVESSRIIAVTSALPGEGKTFTSFNLAMSIAMERDVSVVVIDADLIGRSFTNRLHLSNRPGLSDVLLDPQRELCDVMVDVDIGHLAVIPAGRMADHPSELISSERMRELIRQLAVTYQDWIILLDTAPLLTTSQAALISDLVGQVVVVVEEGKTAQQTVLDALSIISGRNSIGLVLNKSRGASKGSDWPYYGSV